MVRPTKPKDLKPKAEIIADPKAEAKSSGGSGGGGMNEIKLIAVNTVITLLICGLFIASNYFIVQNSLNTVVKQMKDSAGGDSSANNADKASDNGDNPPGIIVDLGEFILNLSDPKIKRYLKINVALELSRKDGDPKAGEAAGGGHGEGADPSKAIASEMSQYKDAIRDAIISQLSSKTAEELQSTAGKELAKEQIKEAVDAILADDNREVQRVSFGNFIIQ
jgi:flagellar protein FliL